MSESTIKKTAEQLNHVLNGLSDYLMAEVSVVEGEKPYLNLRLLDVEKDEELELSPESVTLPQACREIEAYADSYDAEEEREVYTPGENGTPEEPELSEQLRYAEKMYGRISLACNAAEEYYERGNKDAFKRCKEIFDSENRKDLQNGLFNLTEAARYNGMKPSEIQKVLKQFGKELEKSGNSR